MFTTTAFVLNLWISGQHMSTLFVLNDFSSAFTKHLPVCPYDLPVSLHFKLRLCLESLKYNVARQYNVYN